MANFLKYFEATTVKHFFNWANHILSVAQGLLKVNKAQRTVVIQTLPHTLFVANSLKNALQQCGYKVTVEVKSKRKLFPHDCYVVICPQEFKYLPPPQKRISMQMEQCVSDWFDEAYIEILNQSRQVWDYSQKNIEFLNAKNIAVGKLYYMPVSSVPDYRSMVEEAFGKKLSTEKTIDFLFYGNINAERRTVLLEKLGQHFKLRIESSLYGFDILNTISSAKVIVNIHFYEDALLETTRIFECLSLGVKVLSETSIDIKNYPYLFNDSKIAFFNVGDADEMLLQAEKLFYSQEQGQADSFVVSEEILLKNIEAIQKVKIKI